MLEYVQAEDLVNSSCEQGAMLEVLRLSAMNLLSSSIIDAYARIDPSTSEDAWRVVTDLTFYNYCIGGSPLPQSLTAILERSKAATDAVEMSLHPPDECASGEFVARKSMLSLLSVCSSPPPLKTSNSNSEQSPNTVMFSPPAAPFTAFAVISEADQEEEERIRRNLRKSKSQDKQDSAKKGWGWFGD